MFAESNEQDLQGDVRHTDQAGRTVDRFDFPILLTFSNMLEYSAIELTPHYVRKESNEFMTYIRMKMQSKHKKYSELHVGDNVHNIAQDKYLKKGHVSK